MEVGPLGHLGQVVPKRVAEGLGNVIAFVLIHLRSMAVALALEPTLNKNSAKLNRVLFTASGLPGLYGVNVMSRVVEGSDFDNVVARLRVLLSVGMTAMETNSNKRFNALSQNVQAIITIYRR